jgi:hypothetical protein
MSRGLERPARLDLISGAVLAVLETHDGIEALHWPLAERVVSPDTFREEASAGRAIFTGPLNVRLFRIEGRAPGETVMDTLGMRPFWLPDLQVHFFAREPGVERGLDPGEVAGFLYNAAKYLFDAGDVIEDGNTIEGLPRGVRWRCRHELSLTSPRRLVLDVDPFPGGPARPAR